MRRPFIVTSNKLGGRTYRNIPESRRRRHVFLRQLVVTAFRHNWVKWANRAEPDTTKQIAPTSFKQKVIMLNRQFQTEYFFKQDPKKTAAIFLKCDAGEVRTRGPSVSSQAQSRHSIYCWFIQDDKILTNETS